MKAIIYAILALTCAAFSQEWNGTTPPTLNDRDTDSLRKINKTLNDSRTGAFPLRFSLLLSPITVTPGPNEFQGVVYPSNSDNEVFSLRKINKILNDARTGAVPLVVNGGFNPASPGAIGGTTPAAAAFTTVSAGLTKSNNFVMPETGAASASLSYNGDGGTNVTFSASGVAVNASAGAGTIRLLVDGGTVLTVTNAGLTTSSITGTKVYAMEKLGIDPNSIGSVTQLVSKSETVVLDKAGGSIITHNAGLNANTVVSFLLSNDKIEDGDTLVLNYKFGTSGAYVLNAETAGGSALISIRNVTAGTLSEVISIRFTILKGSPF